MKKLLNIFCIPSLILCIILIFNNSIIAFTNKYLVNPIFSSIKQNLTIDVAVLVITLISCIYYYSKFRKELTFCSFRFSTIALIYTVYLLCRNSELWEFTSFSLNPFFYYFDCILLLGVIEIIITVKVIFYKMSGIIIGSLYKDKLKKNILNFIDGTISKISKWLQLVKYNNKESEINASIIRPFIYDNPTLNDDYKRGGYANIICDKLISTYNSSHKSNSKESLPSFTVGISGDWGSGKTSFLKLMKSYLENNNQICYDFSPWLCNSSNEVISEFFKMLRKKLSPYNGNISKTSSNYLRSLVQTDDHWFSKVFSLFMSDNEPSGEEYDKLNEDIKNINKPIFIFIDDLDRLNADEMKEVFNLIRNTANFTNTFFILAYDREYVYNIIKNGGIKKSERYLDKFINLDIELPSHELDIITEMLINEINKNTSISDKDSEILINYILTNSSMNLTYNGTSGILNFFPTIRDVKRFINLFNSTIYSFEKLNSITDIYIYDLFLLELLKFKHRYVYNILKFAPASLLSNYKEKYVIRGRYKPEIKKYMNYDNYRGSDEDSENKKNPKYSLLEFLLCFNKTANEEECVKVSKILGELFVYSTSDNKYSLCYSVNYYRYFLFRLDEKSISISEFISIVNGGKGSTSFLELINQGKDNSLFHLIINLIPSNFIPLTKVLNAIFEYIELKEDRFILYDGWEISGPWITSNNSEYLEINILKLFNLTYIKNINFSDKIDNYKNNINDWLYDPQYITYKAIIIKKLLDNSQLNDNDILKQNLFTYAELEQFATAIINKYFNCIKKEKRRDVKLVEYLRQNEICKKIINKFNKLS